MKMFIFDGVKDLTNAYHCGGGCVVIADSVERAKALVPAGRNGNFVEIGPRYFKLYDPNWPSRGGQEYTAGYYIEMDVVREGPDYSDERYPLPEPEVFDLSDQAIAERVWVFPDAGCC